MNISDIGSKQKLEQFKNNNFSSTMFWKTNIHRYLGDGEKFYSTFIDVPVRRYWDIALVD